MGEGNLRRANLQNYPKPRGELLNLSHGLEVGHHHHVLVFEVVAVEDVAAPVAVETDEHTRLLARGQVHGVLPSGVGRERLPSVAGEHFEVDQVQVDRVRRWGCSQVPDFGSAQLRLGGHTIRVERFAVDTPHHPTIVTHPCKAELARAPGARFLELLELLHVRKTPWYSAIVFLFADDTEAHHAGGLAFAHAVLLRDLPANIVLREIYDHVEALPLRDADRA